MKFTLPLTLLSLLFVGCTSTDSLQPVPQIIVSIPQTEIVNKKVIKKKTSTKDKTSKTSKVKHTMRKVEHTNYSDKYMYPEDTKAAKKDPIKKAPVKKVVVAAVKAESNVTKAPKVVKIIKAKNVANKMSKSECISMMGEDKFTHYSKIFDGEAGAIKRCAMLKAMQ